MLRQRRYIGDESMAVRGHIYTTWEIEADLRDAAAAALVYMCPHTARYTSILLDILVYTCPQTASAEL